MKRQDKIKNIIGIAILLALILPDVFVRIMPSKARRSLPDTATEIREEFEGLICCDHLRLLKARMPQEGFREFIKNYGLKVKYDPTTHDNKITTILNVKYSGSPDWWNGANEKLDDCYFVYEPYRGYCLRQNIKTAVYIFLKPNGKCFYES
jgi:hypothetical protein